LINFASAYAQTTPEQKVSITQVPFVLLAEKNILIASNYRYWEL